MKLAAALFALLLVATAVVARAEPSADDVVAKVRGYYAKVEHVTGDFRQEVVDPSFGTTRKSHGTMKLARPGKLRFDYAKTTGAGVKRSLRSDGKHLWDVEHDNLEVISKDISKDPTPVAVGVLTGRADLAKDFKASIAAKSGFGGGTDVVVQLDPKTASASYKEVFLVVDPADGHIKETVVIDSSGDVNHIYFDKLDTKAAVKDSDFIADLDSKALKNYKLVDADRAAPVTDK